MAYVVEGGGFNQVTIRVLPDGRVSRRDAAVYLGRSERTLAQWAWAGRGPRTVKVGGRCFYRIADLRQFAGQDVAGVEV